MLNLFWPGRQTDRWPLVQASRECWLLALCSSVSDETTRRSHQYKKNTAEGRTFEKQGFWGNILRCRNNSCHGYCCCVMVDLDQRSQCWIARKIGDFYLRWSFTMLKRGGRKLRPGTRWCSHTHLIDLIQTKSCRLFPNWEVLLYVLSGNDVYSLVILISTITTTQPVVTRVDHGATAYFESLSTL